MYEITDKLIVGVLWGLIISIIVLILFFVKKFIFSREPEGYEDMIREKYEIPNDINLYRKNSFSLSKEPKYQVLIKDTRMFKDDVFWDVEKFNKLNEKGLKNLDRVNKD